MDSLPHGTQQDTIANKLGGSFMIKVIQRRPEEDTQNYPFCRLQLVVETLEYSTEWSN